MAGKGPSIALNNGVEMPAIGLGVFLSEPAGTVTAVEAAIANGYRLIDTAAAYKNEQQVGEAIRRSGIDRAEMFVTTKLWLTDWGYDKALYAFDRSMRKLGLDYLDLYLLHFPVPSAFDLTAASYKAAEKLLAEGRVRAIGVSNFSVKHLENLTERVEVTPAVNQIELHPHFTQRALRAAHKRHGIVTQTWSPIGGVNRYWNDNADRLPDPLENRAIVEIARRHEKTPAQVILRWHIENGFSAIPKSVKQKRIAENIDIFDFALNADEMAAIEALDIGERGGADPDQVGIDTLDFPIED